MEGVKDAKRPAAAVAILAGGLALGTLTIILDGGVTGDVSIPCFNCIAKLNGSKRLLSNSLNLLVKICCSRSCCCFPALAKLAIAVVVSTNLLCPTP